MEQNHEENPLPGGYYRDGVEQKNKNHPYQNLRPTWKKRIPLDVKS